MSSKAVLNIRLPEELKQHGNQVLARHGISVSQAVRKMYEYMDKEQDVPKFLSQKSDDSVYDERRATLRKVAGSGELPQDFDVKKAIAEKRDAKYGESV